MQAFNFGIRKSSRENAEDSQHRHHVASSIYSGPGPAEEDMPEPMIHGYDGHHNGERGIFQEDQPRYNPLNQGHPRSSALLNVNDPVTMHLLTETAMFDSKEYEILSFEEVEKLKKERTLLRNRVEATRRKLALELKLRDAAQSLNRLYSTKGRSISGAGPGDDSAISPRKQRRSLLGSRNSSSNNNINSIDALQKADDEFAASSRKVEELTQELVRLERRLEETQRRILEHTAGVLQMTHKGLKKNIKKQELPRSPESMASGSHRGHPAYDGIEDFDERSLYQPHDYGAEPRFRRSLDSGASSAALQAAEQRLTDLTRRIHGMILQSDPEEHIDAPPAITNGTPAPPGTQIQAHLGYLAVGLDAMEAVQARTVAQAQKSLFDTEDYLEDINVRLHDMLERTNLPGQKPFNMPPESREKSMQSQLDISSIVLDQLNERIEMLVEQKDILTRQVQQQRELNSKSDGQRDAQIHNLQEQLEEARQVQVEQEEESQVYRDRVNMLLEQLDLAKQGLAMAHDQQDMNQERALQAERDAHRQVEDNLQADLKVVQDQHMQLHTSFVQLQNDFDAASQLHTQQLDEVHGHLSEAHSDLDNHKQIFATRQEEFEQVKTRHEADVKANQSILESMTQERSQKDTELQGLRNEMQILEAEAVRAQTELTMAKAELDGAYGTRAQRAADVSMNPAIQKEIDELHDKNTQLQRQIDFLESQHTEKGVGSAELKNEINSLQGELRETIEDYEVMTKASIEFEKERDQLEASIDTLRERCESLDAQLSEERVKWLGAKGSAPAETTSTMVLKNEFKKMMRDTRAESIKALRAEQDQRRRLEIELRMLKRDILQTPHKSSLSQSVTAE